MCKGHCLSCVTEQRTKEALHSLTTAPAAGLNRWPLWPHSVEWEVFAKAAGTWQNTSSLSLPLCTLPHSKAMEALAPLKRAVCELLLLAGLA
jgi:hypothetical protein